MENIKRKPRKGPSLLYKALSASRSSLSQPTAASSLLSGSHGRIRRQQRNIAKLDLQRARRYGMKEGARFRRHKYTYAGTVFIYDPIKNKEVTSYPAATGQTTGSAFERPIHLPEYALPGHAYLQSANRRAFLHENPQAITSHSVFVVDMSGSMRCDDVNGARCRADAVWMTVAKDYLLDQLNKGDLTSSDVVSVVAFRDTAELLVAQAPADHVLFNQILRFREFETLRPEGTGNYMPALDMAERMLEWRGLRSCALSLLFFSDGKPSDRGNFVERTGRIAAKFGHRLTIRFLGMAEPSEDFAILQAMAAEAHEFGAQSVFQRPSMRMSELSSAISSLASSLCTTKTSMIDPKTGRRHVVRTDFQRERRSAVNDCLIKPNHEWKVYANHCVMNYVLRISTWDTRQDEFVYLMDSRCVFCYTTVSAGFDGAIQTIGSKTVSGSLCPNCQACFICVRCNRPHDLADCLEFRRQQSLQKMTRREVPSFSVAMKNSVFGEGAERIVRQFRFLDDNGDFAGPKWVAKESRFVHDGDQLSRLTYHKDFMRTQVLAQQFATKFNHALDLFGQESRNWPRFRFLEPLVVELVEDGKHSARVQREIMIEEMLDGEYRKFNNNHGFVMKAGEMTPMRLGPIAEADGDDDETMASSAANASSEMCVEITKGDQPVALSAAASSKMCVELPKTPVAPSRGASVDMWVEDFPQAFSHFSYEESRKKCMVVDLQGVFVQKPDGTSEYVLTDPAIHRRDRHLGSMGRTDHGEEGMRAFLQSHRCNRVCRMLRLALKED